MGAFLYWTPKGALQPPAASAFVPAPNSSILWFDVTVEEKHPFENEITEHPVEDGPDVTDHIRANPDHCSIRVFVTNTPVYTAQEIQPQLSLQAQQYYGMQSGGIDIITGTYPTAPQPPSISGALEAVANALLSGNGQSFGSVNKPFSAYVKKFDDAVDNVVGVYEKLRELRDNGQILNIATSVRYYQSMVIKSVEMDRSQQGGGAGGAYIDIEFKQITIVSTQTVPAPTEVAATVAVNRGAKSKVAATPQQRVTIAAKIDDALGKPVGF